MILKRTLKVIYPKMSGSDVKALQRELTAKGWHLPITGTYGKATSEAVYKAKKKIKGYPLRIVNHQAGPYFARKLTAYKPSTPRSRFVALLRWGIANEPKIHYFTGPASRPIRLSPIHSLPIYTDCTGIGILFAKQAGCPDPSGYKFSGSGRTSDFYAHCKHTRKDRLKPGDIVQFDDHHACYVLEPGYDPLLFSHGMERGPLAIRQSAERKYHSKDPIYYLSFLGD